MFPNCDDMSSTCKTSHRDSLLGNSRKNAAASRNFLAVLSQEEINASCSENVATAIGKSAKKYAYQKRWSRFAGQFGGLAKVDSGFDYAANFSSFACLA